MEYAIDLCIYANSFVDSFFKDIHRSNQNVHSSSRAKLRTVECQGLLNDRTKMNTQRRSGSIYGRNKFNAIFLYQRQRLSWISSLTHCSSNVHYAKCNVMYNITQHCKFLLMANLWFFTNRLRWHQDQLSGAEIASWYVNIFENHYMYHHYMKVGVKP